VHATAKDLPRFHGTNERISVVNYAEMIQFYERLMRQASEAP
jgi:carboxypeptidase PM20D1